MPNQEEPTVEGVAVYTQKDRSHLLAAGGSFRKTARIVALRIEEPFAVETEHGTMTGEAGDWLATNDPADDPGSDVWVIANERMRSTYTPANDS